MMHDDAASVHSSRPSHLSLPRTEYEGPTRRCAANRQDTLPRPHNRIRRREDSKQKELTRTIAEKVSQCPRRQPHTETSR